VIITRRTLARRTFLRGAGAAIALPLLDAMVPALAQSSAPKAKRIGFIYMPNGVAMNFEGVNFWTPKTTGKNLELSRILTPLAPFKDQLTVVSGLAHHEADAQDDGANGDHTRATSSWLSGARAKRTEGADVQSGITADQVAAHVLGRETPLPSLELAIDLNFLSGQCENSYACIYLNTLAWAGPKSPLPTENNPRIVFERLFGNGGTTAQRAALAQQNRSILDSVSEDFAKLARTLGPQDRTQVDSYLQSVREVERRIAAVEHLGDSADLPALERPRGIPEIFGDHVKLMYELQWLAFQADMTRVVTFMLGRELNFRTYPEIGFLEGHHGVSHHGDRPEQLEKLARLNTYQTELFAGFLNKLKSTPDGDGTLLDHSLFLYGASLSNPNLHAHYDLPLTLVGGAGGALEGDRHVVFPAETPMANLLLTMLDKVGVPTESIGDSTEPLRV
jgi:hypothetical protein